MNRKRKWNLKMSINTSKIKTRRLKYIPGLDQIQRNNSRIKLLKDYKANKNLNLWEQCWQLGPLHKTIISMLLSEIQNSLKLALPYPDKKVFKKLFGKRAIVWLRLQSSVLNIFRDRFWKLANFSLVIFFENWQILAERFSK